MDNTNSVELEHPLDEASRLYGGRAALAKALGVSVSAYGNWKMRGVPFEQCPRIESLVPSVTRQRLRPNDFGAMWPELDESGKRNLSHDSSFPVGDRSCHSQIEGRRI